jgi:hypothetical protein
VTSVPNSIWPRRIGDILHLQTLADTTILSSHRFFIGGHTHRVLLLLFGLLRTGHVKRRRIDREEMEYVKAAVLTVN